MDFGNTLKTLRETNHVTQGQLAKFLRVSRPTIAGYETKNHQPDFERLIKIAEYFHVSIDYLIKGTALEDRTPIKENTINQEVMASYQRLSIESKQNVLRYIRLLELRDKEAKR